MPNGDQESLGVGDGTRQGIREAQEPIEVVPHLEVIEHSRSRRGTKSTAKLWVNQQPIDSPS
jgi:hypothetical protein